MKFGKVLFFAISIGIGLLFVSFLSKDVTQHQFTLDYNKSARLIIDDHIGNITEQHLLEDSLQNFTAITFCGKGDSMGDVWVRIISDTQDEISFGIGFPNEEGIGLILQSAQTGYSNGCTPVDQPKFKVFFDEHIRSQ